MQVKKFQSAWPVPLTAHLENLPNNNSSYRVRYKLAGISTEIQITRWGSWPGIFSMLCFHVYKGLNFHFRFNGYMLVEEIDERYACAGLDICRFISVG